MSWFSFSAPSLSHLISSICYFYLSRWYSCTEQEKITASKVFCFSSFLFLFLYKITKFKITNPPFTLLALYLSPGNFSVPFKERSPVFSWVISMSCIGLYFLCLYIFCMCYINTSLLLAFCNINKSFTVKDVNVTVCTVISLVEVSPPSLPAAVPQLNQT